MWAGVLEFPTDLFNCDQEKKMREENYNVRKRTGKWRKTTATGGGGGGVGETSLNDVSHVAKWANKLAVAVTTQWHSYDTLLIVWVRVSCSSCSSLRNTARLLISVVSKQVNGQPDNAISFRLIVGFSWIFKSVFT